MPFLQKCNTAFSTGSIAISFINSYGPNSCKKNKSNNKERFRFIRKWFGKIIKGHTHHTRETIYTKFPMAVTIQHVLSRWYWHKLPLFNTASLTQRMFKSFHDDIIFSEFYFKVYFFNYRISLVVRRGKLPSITFYASLTAHY